MLAIAPSFHFSIESIALSLTSIVNLEGMAVILIVIILLIFAFILAALCERISKSAMHPVAGILLFFLAIVLAQIDLQAKKQPQWAHVDFSTSALWGGARIAKYWYEGQLDDRKTVNSELMLSATQRLFNDIENGGELPGTIVLVVMESLGASVDPTLSQLQLPDTLFESVKDRYLITEGIIDFEGSTVPAEIRELCRRHMAGVLVDMGNLNINDCLVKQLNRLDYKTTAIHGFPGAMFDRIQWYPAMGFDEVLFLPELDVMLGNKERCGNSFFQGGCDHMIADWLGQEILFEANQNRFIYWLTLNAHTPVAMLPEALSRIDCELAAYQNIPREVCELAKIHRLIIKKLTTIASQAKDTAFIIVGDHSPAFQLKESRKLYSDKKVPYRVLWPKPQ